MSTIAGAPEQLSEAVAVDGRRRRSDRSRKAILDASTALIAESGVSSLTHRSVAGAAGVPPGRVSYHFPRIDDLLVAASAEYLRSFDERLRTRAEAARAGERSIADVCTDVIHELVTDGAPEFLGMVEVRLVLARRGRSTGEAGIVALIESFGAEPPQAVAIASAMFGFAVLAASELEPVSREQVAAHVGRILGGAS